MEETIEPNALVSIVTPAFNVASYLSEAIESCLAQTYTNFELLIVNDGSTDATGAVAERFTVDTRVRVFRTANQGISAARNLAIKQSRGTVFALLDGDDRWMPSYLQTQLTTLRRHPEADIVTANAINSGGPLDGVPYWPSSDQIRPISLIEMIEREDAVHIMTVLRRSVVDLIGGFDGTYKGNEDYQFWLRAAVAGCQFLADFTPQGYYRRRPNSISSDERRMLTGIIRVFREIRPLCPLGGVEIGAIDGQLRRFERELLVAEARHCILTNGAAGAVAWLRRIPLRDRGPVLLALLSVATLWPPALSYSYRAKTIRAVR